MTTTDLAVPVREPDTEYDRLARLGQWLAASEGSKEPRGPDGMAAALRFYYARELGMPPLAAAELSVINGRLFVGAKLLRALAAKAGYRVVKVNSTPETCTAILVDLATGIEVGQVTYTIQEAQKAGLIRDRSAWKSHPARMLWARASKFVLDDYAPEVTLGIYTDEERAEIDGSTLTVEQAIEQGLIDDLDADFGPVVDEDLNPSAFHPPAEDDE